ncbi:hypothetical protein TSMEX_000560 [Taenia solium]|eukprot:TsM_000177800 transcript=TsM_000177800 gene=TsM_000177800
MLKSSSCECDTEVDGPNHRRCAEPTIPFAFPHDCPTRLMALRTHLSCTSFTGVGHFMRKANTVKQREVVLAEFRSQCYFFCKVRL